MSDENVVNIVVEVELPFDEAPRLVAGLIAMYDHDERCSFRVSMRRGCAWLVARKQLVREAPMTSPLCAAGSFAVDIGDALAEAGTAFVLVGRVRFDA